MRIEKARKRKKKRIRNRFIFRLLVLLILVGAIVFALVSNFNKDKTTYDVGDEAPDFKLNQVSDRNELEEVRLSDYLGKGVMLNFWASRSEEHTSELQSRGHLVCRLLLEK